MSAPSVRPAQDRARAGLKAFDFRKLFVEELGWANCKVAPFEIRT
jgi:hypothetical protein